MLLWNAFRITGPLCRESISRWTEVGLTLNWCHSTGKLNKAWPLIHWRHELGTFDQIRNQFRQHFVPKAEMNAIQMCDRPNRRAYGQRDKAIRSSCQSLLRLVMCYGERSKGIKREHTVRGDPLYPHLISFARPFLSAWNISAEKFPG